MSITVQNEILDWLIEIFDRTVTCIDTEVKPTPLVIFNGAVLEHEPYFVYD